jgi:hypothetical protein
MGNRIENRVVLGSLRYKSASNTDLVFQVPFIQTSKQNVEYDRNIDVDLAQLFDDERQNSDIFRPTCKLSVLFSNSYTGTTSYFPLKNNLYYVNEKNFAINNCPINTNIPWAGFPQYDEFDLSRSDNMVTGYTKSPNNHINFITKSGSSYNWNYYLSYPFENDYEKQLQCVEPITKTSLDWKSKDGIPFIITSTQSNGNNLVTFRCPIKHGLSAGEFVKLNFSYNGINTFSVYSLGDNFSGSEEYVFNIYNVGFTGVTFNPSTEGSFKRIISIENITDTISTYYVRRHKIMTNVSNSVLTKAGFDQNIFGVKKKYESKQYTPNKQSRISLKEGSQSYTLSFNEDVKINGILDNQKRPISELFFTIIWKGYFGLTFGRLKNSNEYYSMKQGYEFNLPLSPINGKPTIWWNDVNSLSDTNFKLGNYTTTMGVDVNKEPIVFTYVESLQKDDILDGDLCEWNNFEQKERVISKLHHKITFNPKVFNIGTPIKDKYNPFGYYYQPHHSLTIREYSSYIEEGDKKNVLGIPNYAYFSSTKNTFIWRDLYTYGYIDSDNIGVNYPFINGTHYPFRDIIFRLIPEGTNYIENTIIAAPIIDNCE